MKATNDCSCYKCNGACEVKPGWFTPDEIPVLAQNMGMTEQELFQKHLQIDYWIGSEGNTSTGEDVFVLAPAANGRSSGDFYPMNPRGRCVFYDKDKAGGRCGIHTKGKPYECAMALPHADKSLPNGESNNHNAAMKAWDNPEAQKYIRTVSGIEELMRPEGGGMDELLSAIFG